MMAARAFSRGIWKMSMNSTKAQRYTRDQFRKAKKMVEEC